MISIFDTEKIQAQIEKVKTVKHYIGVDTYDPNSNAYTLVREIDGNFEFILSKTIPDPKEFETEVSNLAKYFNVEVKDIKRFQ